MTREENRHLNMVGAFVSGGLIGAGIALLFAPRSGKETRQSITRLGQAAQREIMQYQSETRDRIDHVFTNLQKDLHACLDDGKSWTKDQISKLENTLQNGKRKIKTEMDRILGS